MRIRHGRILVIDLELTMWEGAPPPGFLPEIVELGVVELQLEGPRPVIGRRASWLARPRKGSVSHEFTALTGITEGELHRARPLDEVLASCAKMFGQSGHAWAAWGGDDEAVREACAILRRPMMFGGPFYDLGFLYGALSGGGRGIGLPRALEELGMSFEGRRHRAGDDALNAARVLACLSDMLRANMVGRREGYPTPS